ncbi:hypothetical protein D3C80_1421140 [compost metagenome]
MVGRNPVPGRLLCAGLTENILVGLLVIIPVLPLLQITGVELPVLSRIMKPLLDFLQLLLLRDMQEQLDYCRALLHQHFLKLADVAESPFHVFLLETAVYPGYKDIFIMGAVEGSDITLGRGLHMHSPQKIMCLLLKRRLFEAGNNKALGVNAGKDMLHCSILSA